jgi:hypothetical protein
MSDDVPVFARCSLGKGRWFWAMWSSRRSWFDGEPPAYTGYAISPKAAEAAASDLVPLAERIPAHAAESVHREVAAGKHAVLPGRASGPLAGPGRGRREA